MLKWLLIFLSDLGKVLAGIQVPQQDYLQFDQFLQKLDYSYVEETDNNVYKRFLQGWTFEGIYLVTLQKICK